MERIGIYGGSFNPPHLGHIQAAKFAVQKLKLDRLLMIPAGIAPHKQQQMCTVTGEQRLHMLELAVEDCEAIEVSDLELRREGPSYTFQTVQQLRSRYPEAELTVLMGADMFSSFLNWKNARQIYETAAIGVFYRGEADEVQAVEAQKEELEKRGAKVIAVCNQVLPISSTDLRRMLAFQCADSFLPPRVAEYIYREKLYETGACYRNLPMEQLENVVIQLLNPNRVAHVLGCRDTCAALARRWGADEVIAARAGILHDITKALNGSLQLTLCQAYGTMLDKFSQENPKTLHALTGSLVAKRIFGECDEVAAAIRSHTTGKPNMNLLEKIVYVADYMEPGRNFPGVEKLRELAFQDLDGALQLGLEMTLSLLRERNQTISPESKEALEYLYKHKT